MNQGYPPPGQPVPNQAPVYGQPPGQYSAVPAQYGYPQQPVYIVQQQDKNGLALAGMILGIIGVVIGLIPLFFLGALGCGILALIFGLIGRGKQKRVRRKMAWSGAILGVVALALGILGAAIVSNAVDDLDDCLEAISDDFDDGGNRSDAACD